MRKASPTHLGLLAVVAMTALSAVADAIVEGKCTIARGNNDAGGVLQVDTINQSSTARARCPRPADIRAADRLPLDGRLVATAWMVRNGTLS